MGIEFKIYDEVEAVSGFYKGIVGTIVDKSRNDYQIRHYCDPEKIIADFPYISGDDLKLYKEPEEPSKLTFWEKICFKIFGE